MKGFNITYQNYEIKIEVTIQKNIFDHFYCKVETIDFGFEGVLLNLNSLINKYAAINITDLFFKMYSQRNISFLDELEGEFCGFIYDPENNYVHAYTNFTATKKLFYYYEPDFWIIDSSLPRLSNQLKKNNIPLSLDVESGYSLLVCGNMLEDFTPIKNVKKLRNGEVISFNLTNTSKKIINYSPITETASYSGTKLQAIDTLHEIFSEAVNSEYKKDQELKLSPLALLSGGLDSRVALLYAMNLNFKPEQTLCFSQSGYWDEIIARQIAEDLNIPLLFVPLNGGGYLKDIDDLTKISEGLVRYAGGIHTHYSFKFINKENIGLVHSGQLGDGILGGFNLHPFKAPPTQSKIIASSKLYSKFKPVFQSVIDQYDSEELFFLRNIGYNRAVMGSYTAEEFSYQTSPFMNSSFIKFGLSLPEKWKYNQNIYIEWINKHCLKATKYKWERTLLTPDAKWKTIIGDKVIKRVYKVLINHIFKQPEKGDMTAYEYYYNTDKDIHSFINNYFEDTIHLLAPPLQEDALFLFKQGTFNEKLLVLTLLATAKKYLS